MRQPWEVGHVSQKAWRKDEESMQMKYKKDDFSSLPVDSTGPTYDLICYKAEPTVGSPRGGASTLHFYQK